MIVKDFLFGKCRWGICWVSKWTVDNLFFYQAAYLIDLQTIKWMKALIKVFN